MNQVNIIGRVGTVIEGKTTPSGKRVCSFPLAVKDRNNTVWITVVAWEKNCELCERFLGKGVQVGIEGRLSSREYTDKNGEKRKVIEVIAEDLTFIDKKESETEQLSGKVEKEVEVELDDLPF